MFDTKGKMFDSEEMYQRYGDVRLAKWYSDFKEMESFLISQKLPAGVDYCFDLMASEPPKFSTINYTNISSLFYIHPLNLESRSKQIWKCLTNPEPVIFNYSKYFKELSTSDNSGKYSEHSEFSFSGAKALIVLPGFNHLFGRCCFNKINYIIEKYSGDVIVKPHPLTNAQEFKQLEEIFGEKAKLADPKENVHQYMLLVDNVYLSGNSDSVLFAVSLDKNIDIIDTYQDRERGIFWPLLYAMISTPKTKRKSTLDKILNNYRSGFFHPIHSGDWKRGIRKYIKDVLELRELSSSHYIFKHPGEIS